MKRKISSNLYNVCDRIYLKLIDVGRKTGCHQRADRSFFINGYQFPICARCTGVLIGYLITIPIIIKVDVKITQCFACAFVMLLDWLIQYYQICESTNLRRVITGIFGGFGVFATEILFVKYIICEIIK